MADPWQWACWALLLLKGLAAGIPCRLLHMLLAPCEWAMLSRARRLTYGTHVSAGRSHMQLTQTWKPWLAEQAQRLPYRKAAADPAGWDPHSFQI